MLKPALALVSINITLSSRALLSPSSIDTCLVTWKHKVTQGTTYSSTVVWRLLLMTMQCIQHGASCTLKQHIETTPTIPFVYQVGFVAHKHNDDIAASFCSYFINPPCRVEKGLSVCDVRYGCVVAAHALVRMHGHCTLPPQPTCNIIHHHCH